MITRQELHTSVTQTLDKVDQAISATPISLVRGQNLVNATGDGIIPFNVLSIKGRTLINLLGRDGNCEDTSKWTPWFSSTLTLDSTNKKYGSNSIKATATGTSGVGMYQDITSKLKSNSYYIAISESFNSSANYSTVVAVSSSGTSSVGNFVSNRTNFGVSYVKFTTPASVTQSFLYAYNTAGTVTIGDTVNNDGIRLFEITQTEYNAIDTMTTAQIAEKYPYIDDMKSLQNPYVNVYGSNLLPDFSQWTLHANAVITDSYKLTLNATGTFQNTDILVNVTPNTLYTYNVQTSGTVRVYNGTNDTSGVLLSANGSFTPTVSQVLVRVTSGNTASGTFTFTNPMLNLGSTALPFVPRNDSPVYFQTSLASSVDGTIYDSVAPINGGFVKTSRFKELVLDGTLGWSFVVDATGHKTVKIPLTGFVTNVGNLVKYDGKIGTVIPSGSLPSADTFALSDAFYVSIADTDSGWGESYTPSVAEIQAYFNGWLMSNSTTNSNTLYDGTGTKTWWARGLSGVYVTTCPTTLASSNYTPYRLLYQLAQPTQETIVTEGLYPVLQAGANQVELGESVQVRELAKPKLDSGYYYINISNAYPNGASQLNYMAKKILKVYLKGTEFTKWKYSASSYKYGDEAIYINQSDYNGTDPITVTYIAQPFAVSSSILSLDGSYESNLRKDVDKNTQNISDLAEKVTALEISKANRNQPNWIAPTLLNGWVNYSSVTNLTSYFKDEFNIVHIQGFIKSGTTTAGTVLFYLPVGYRPKTTISMVTISNNGSGEILARIEINSNGAVSIYLGGNTWLFLNNIHFLAEQ